MKPITILLALILINATISYSQSRNDSITTKKTFGNYRYYQGEVELGITEMEFIMNSNTLALKELGMARKLNTTSTVIAGLGGSLVGATLGIMAARGRPNLLLGGLGVGLILVSIPIALQHYYHLDRAMDMHNSGLKSTTSTNMWELSIGFSNNGLSLTLKF